MLLCVVCLPSCLWLLVVCALSIWCCVDMCVMALYILGAIYGVGVVVCGRVGLCVCWCGCVRCVVVVVGACVYGLVVLLRVWLCSCVCVHVLLLLLCVRC